MTLDDIVLTIAPELSQLSTDARAMFENFAIVQVQWGQAQGFQQMGQAYLAAHMMTMATRSGIGGQLTSKREGDLAVSFNALPYMGGYEQTSYGLEYLRLSRQCVISVTTRAASWPNQNCI